MNATIEHYEKEQTEVELYYSEEFKGRGGWNINCEVKVGKGSGYTGGATKVFRTYTTDSQFIDTVSDLKDDNASFDQIQAAYHDKFFDSISEAISEWCSGQEEEDN